ncbi:transposase [Streptomyces sp. NPDC001530]|uniref:transposase n=1 Tax=Streptomyces sp. NPDC001530 TaxID=3364582 RepID=UPI003690F60A
MRDLPCAPIVRHSRKVRLVVDGHTVHRSDAVRDWLSDHPDRIELHFLPSYAPELNADELANADLKRKPSATIRPCSSPVRRGSARCPDEGP